MKKRYLISYCFILLFKLSFSQDFKIPKLVLESHNSISDHLYLGIVEFPDSMIFIQSKIDTLKGKPFYVHYSRIKFKKDSLTNKVKIDTISNIRIFVKDTMLYSKESLLSIFIRENGSYEKNVNKLINDDEILILIEEFKKLLESIISTTSVLDNIDLNGYFRIQFYGKFK